MKRSLLFQLGVQLGAQLGDPVEGRWAPALGAAAGPRGGVPDGEEELGLLERWSRPVRLADELGIDTLWCLPALDDSGRYGPDTVSLWLSSVAGQTNRIRLAWGVPGMLPPDRPPIRTAEQAASLDQASRGRLDLALLPDETGTTDRPGWDEGLRMLVDMWDRATFSWGSDRFQVPPVDVLPKPQQSPHPPLFLVGWCDAQARTAGRSGLGFFDVSGGDDATLEMHRDGYLATRAEVAAEDLVCHSAYAAAFEYAGEEACRARLEAFEQIGVDEAVLRAVGDAGFGLEGDDAWRSLESRIRLLAGESPELH